MIGKFFGKEKNRKIEKSKKELYEKRRKTILLKAKYI